LILVKKMIKFKLTRVKSNSTPNENVHLPVKTL